MTDIGPAVIDADANLNPLTRSLVNSYLERLDQFIDRTKNRISDLEKTLKARNYDTDKKIEDLKAPINEDHVIEGVGQALSQTQKKMDEMRIDLAKRQPIALKVGEQVKEAN